MRVMTSNKPIVRALNGQAGDEVPFWLMRQAGRYLPEYREVRAQAGGFLNLAFNPDLACEVTMQPLRRYGMDAAILFSDILVVPMGLGQKLEFATGEGPVLDAIRVSADIPSFNADYFDSVINPVYETVRRVRSAMTSEGFTKTTLIGFAGSPWTVATYMVEGGSSRTFETVKDWAHTDLDSFAKLIAVITEATIHYLRAQIEAGAEVLQLFDSWAGALQGNDFTRWIIEPTRRIVEALNATHPHIPVIGFPRGAGGHYEAYLQQTKVTALGLDQSVPLAQAQDLQKQAPVQGLLNPETLLAGGDNLVQETQSILQALGDGPFIFNLGHGIIKETPPEHVLMLRELIRNQKREAA